MISRVVPDLTINRIGINEATWSLRHSSSFSLWFFLFSLIIIPLSSLSHGIHLLQLFVTHWNGPSSLYFMKILEVVFWHLPFQIRAAGPWCPKSNHLVQICSFTNNECMTWQCEELHGPTPQQNW